MHSIRNCLPALLLLCACATLAQAGDEASQLIELLRGPDATVVRDAAYTLCGLGEHAASAVPELRSLLHRREAQPGDMSAQVREVAAYALGCIGPAAQPAIADVTDLLAKDSSWEVRRTAAHALAKFGALPDAAILALGEAARDNSNHVEVKRAAANSLAVSGAEAAAAVPALTDALSDHQPEVQRVAAYALGRIGPAAKTAVPELTYALQEGVAEVKENAAFALGRVGIAAHSALPTLEKLLWNGNANVRRVAAEAMQSIGSPAHAQQALRSALSKGNDGVRETAAAALGRMGIAGRSALPDLIQALRDANPQVRQASAEAIGSLALALQDSTDWTVLPTMEQALTALNATNGANGFRSPPTEAIRRVEETLRTLKTRRRMSWLNKLFGWTDRKWPATVAFVIAAYCGWLLILRFVIVRRWPLRVLAWNDALASYSDLQLPGWLGGVKVSIRHLLCIGFFQFHDRVLSAWIDAYVASVFETFQRRETYRARSTYVPLPVVVNGEVFPSLTADRLQALCGRDRWYIEIRGEGGAGKTTLACQLALWAMDAEPRNRLIEDRRMLPVLIEPSLGVDVRKDVTALRRAAREQLQAATGAAEPVSDKLFERLLRTRRVLVILDGLSEMIRDRAVMEEQRVMYEHLEFPANALVVTSRIEVWISQQPDLAVQPLRIDTNHLLPFMNAYLSQAGFALADHEIYDACRRLAQMVGTQRGITPLLARLYAGEIVNAAQHGAAAREMPGTIPDLMLAYLNTLNRHYGADRPDNPDLHRAVGITAWECLRRTFRSGPAKIEEVASALKAAQIAPSLLMYLETSLRLIRRIPPAETSVHFLLDPIAEYLAGLHCVGSHHRDGDRWREFLNQGDSMPGSPEAIRGFLVAVRDCCEARKQEYVIPEFVMAELDRRIDGGGAAAPTRAVAAASEALAESPEEGRIHA